MIFRNWILSHLKPPVLVVRIRSPFPILSPTFWEGFQRICMWVEWSMWFIPRQSELLQLPYHSDSLRYGYVIQWPPTKFTKTFSLNLTGMIHTVSAKILKAFKLVLFWHTDTVRKAKREKLGQQHFLQHFVMKFFIYTEKRKPFTIIT